MTARADLDYRITWDADIRRYVFELVAGQVWEENEMGEAL